MRGSGGTDASRASLVPEDMTRPRFAAIPARRQSVWGLHRKIAPLRVAAKRARAKKLPMPPAMTGIEEKIILLGIF
jgi:hypothetical protein